jgi:hypothetical protein
VLAGAANAYAKNYHSLSNKGRKPWIREHDQRLASQRLPPEHTPELKEQFEVTSDRDLRIHEPLER